MPVLKNKVLQYYQIFCNLSLDVVGGVICNMFALVHCFRLDPPFAWYIALPTGTWLIYLADHVVDVIRTKKEYPTPRHRFIKQHLYAAITMIAMLAATLLFITIYYYDPQLIICGSIMFVIIVIHLLITRINPQSKSIWNNKEFGVSFIYATSIYIYPIMVLLQSPLLDVVFYVYASFLLVTYQNLLLCSIIEYPVDIVMNNTSLIRSVGINIGKLIFKGVSLSALVILLIVNVFYDFYNPLLPTCYFLILSGNFVLFMWNDRLQKHLLYRKIAELLFWLPVLSLLR